MDMTRARVGQAVHACIGTKQWLVCQMINYRQPGDGLTEICVSCGRPLDRMQ